MNTIKQAVLLVGHGGLPKDIPQQAVESFMKIHKQRIRTGAAITNEEKELESVIRNWKRTPESDPYQAGLESLASSMKPRLDGYILKTAYNEFCYPSIETAVDELAEKSVSKIILITTMITRGGSHSEVEIPEELEALSEKYPDIDFQYAWPFSMDSFALFLTDHVKNFQPELATNIN
jgi:sirohydrochlorin cobaltochelatase